MAQLNSLAIIFASTVRLDVFRNIISVTIGSQ